MVNTSRELVKEMNEVMDLAIKSIITFDNLSEMSEDEIRAIKAINRIWKNTTDLLIKQAETIVELNERSKEMAIKLDLLLNN